MNAGERPARRTPEEAGTPIERPDARLTMARAGVIERVRWERQRRTGDRGRDYRYGRRGSYDRHRAAADHSG